MTAQDRDGPFRSNRDDALERAWREASTERPPPDVDAGVLAAARAAVAKREEAGDVRRRAKPWVARWQPALAAAAVAGLALVLVPMLPREQGSVPTSQRQQRSTAAPAAESASPSAPAPQRMDATPPASRSQVEPEFPEQLPRAVPVPSPSQAPVEVPPAPARSEIAERASGSDTPAPTAAPAPASRTTAAADAAAATFGQAAPPPPDVTAWASRIEALHAAGNFEAAARELRAFRAVDPRADTYLPEPLRAWARTVEPFPLDPPRE